MRKASENLFEASSAIFVIQSLLIMVRTWLIDGRGLAKAVRNAGDHFSAYQIEDCGANRQCPNCRYWFGNTDVSHDWPGLPAGVKFDPSDVELLQHLAAKCGVGNLEPHEFIDEFIPTVESDEGICYTHPENLPGAKKDGSSIHFFYKITNAYSSGQRKRRRIHDKTHVRWHKTGKTKPITEKGIQKGCKKIMVLYATPKRGSRPDKHKWVMHQYHLGSEEDEREGKYVVCKIFCQPHKEIDKNESSLVISESEMGTVEVIPRTPNMNIPDPPRGGQTPSFEDSGNLKNQSHRQYDCRSKNQNETVGESEPLDLTEADFIYWDEILNSYAAFGNFKPNKATSLAQSTTKSTTENENRRDGNSFYRIGDLDGLELDTPPDFQLHDLQFASQDSVFD